MDENEFETPPHPKKNNPKTGWELHVPWESTAAVYASLMSAGAEFGLVNAGYRAIDSLSIEKVRMFLEHCRVLTLISATSSEFDSGFVGFFLFRSPGLPALARRPAPRRRSVRGRPRFHVQTENARRLPRPRRPRAQEKGRPPQETRLPHHRRVRSGFSIGFYLFLKKNRLDR